MSYQWSTGSTNTHIYVSQPQVGDTVSVAYVENDGCFGTIYYVFQPSQVQSDTTYNVVNSCLWTPLYNLHAPGGFVNYLWSTGLSGNTLNVPYPNQGQQIFVEMTANTGCKSYAGYTFNLVNNFPTNLNVTFGQFCQTTKELELSAPAGYQAYFWSTGQYGQTVSISDPAS